MVQGQNDREEFMNSPEIFQQYFESEDYKLFSRGKGQVEIIERDKVAGYLKLRRNYARDSGLEKEVFLNPVGFPVSWRDRSYSAGQVNYNLGAVEKEWRVNLSVGRQISFVFDTTTGNIVAATLFSSSGELIWASVEPYLTFVFRGEKPQLYQEVYSLLVGFARDGNFWRYSFTGGKLDGDVVGQLQVGEKIIDPSGMFKYRIDPSGESFLKFTGTEISTGHEVALLILTPQAVDIGYWHALAQVEDRSWRNFAERVPVVPLLLMSLPMLNIEK